MQKYCIQNILSDSRWSTLCIDTLGALCMHSLEEGQSAQEKPVSAPAETPHIAGT